MNFPSFGERWKALRAASGSMLVIVGSVVRGLPLFMSARPQTPLRVLCIMAFDVLHRLRHARPLSSSQIRTLAALLDFAACANAACDNKDYCRQAHLAALHLLVDADVRGLAREYLRRLRNLERGRPAPGEHDRHAYQVALYREAAVRLSLGMLAAATHINRSLDDGIRATWRDADLNILFRGAMQCQIIDDVLDYPLDLSAGLPSFLTATRSFSRALELTRLAALRYADDRDLPRTGELLPLRCALFFVSSLTKLAIHLGRWKYRRRCSSRTSVNAGRYRGYLSNEISPRG